MTEESIANKTARTAFWSAIQKIFTMGVQFVVTMVLARLLLPTDYGVIALMTVFFALANSIADCGFSNALIRKDECTQEDYSTAFFYNVLVSVGLYLLIFLVAPFVSDFYEIPILCDVMRVSGLIVIINSVNLVPVVQLTRNLDFKTFALAAVVSSVISGSTGVLMAYWGAGVWALVAQTILGGLLSMLIMVYKVRWIPSFSFSKESFHYLWSFGSKMLLTGIISTIYANIYSIVIGKCYNSRTLGIYNRGQSLSMLIPDVVNNIFNRNTLPILSQLKNEKERMIAVYRKLVVLVSFFNIPLCLFFAALAKPFVLFFLTDKWLDSVVYLQLFALSAITSSAGVINLNIFQAEGRSDITLKIEVIKKIIGFFIVFVLLPMGPLVLAIGSMTFNFFCYVVNLYYANKLEHLSFSTQILDLVPILIASVVSSIFAYGITLLDLSNFMQLILGGIVGLMMYVLITKFVMKMDLYDQIFDLIKNKIK